MFLSVEYQDHWDFENIFLGFQYLALSFVSEILKNICEKSTEKMAICCVPFFGFFLVFIYYIHTHNLAQQISIYALVIIIEIF